MKVRAVAAVVLFTAAIACGARSSLWSPEELSGSTGAGGMGCPPPSMVVTASIGGPIERQLDECLDWPDDKPCPSAAQAEKILSPQCSTQIVSIDCGPVREGARCCYLVTEVCGYS